MRTLFSFLLIIVLLTGCIPLGDSQTPNPIDKETPVITGVPETQEPTSVTTTEIEESANSNGKLLEGLWDYECDVLKFNRYTWTSSLEFKHAHMVVEISFDDLDIQLGDTSLAFIIRSDVEEYRNDWLYVRTDGTFDPDLAYFNKFGLMEIYPGGYESFEQELIDMNIDWVTLYQKVKVEFYLMYLSDKYHCPVEPELPTVIG